MKRSRIKDRVPLVGIHEAIAALPADDFGEFTADRFHLYRSDRGASGSSYTKLKEFVFVKS